jgi:uncharacterized protein YjdB
MPAGRAFRRATIGASALALLLPLGGCEEKAPSITIPIVVPVQVTLDLKPDAVTLAVGQTARLTPIVTGTTNQNATFASSNTSVATVTADGNVEARSAGTAVITAVSVADSTARDGSTVTVSAQPPPGAATSP